MIINTLQDFETYINNIYLVCKNKDKTLMESYFFDEFIHPYRDFSSIDVKDIYFILFKKNIQNDTFPKFIFVIYGSNYSIDVQISFLDVRQNIDYMNTKIKNKVVDKYFKDLDKYSNNDIVEISLEEFINLMKLRNKTK